MNRFYDALQVDPLDCLGVGMDMAAGDLLIPDVLALYRDEPLQGQAAKRGFQQGFDYVNKNDLQRPGDVIFVKEGAGGMSNPEIIIQTNMHTAYSGGNGITLSFHVYGVVPLISGVARFGLSAERLKPATAGDVYNQNRWGTEVAADVTIPTTSGRTVLATITLTAAEAGTIAVGDGYRLRLRRLNTHANDTADGDVGVNVAFLKQAA